VSTEFIRRRIVFHLSTWIWEWPYYPFRPSQMLAFLLSIDTPIITDSHAQTVHTTDAMLFYEHNHHAIIILTHHLVILTDTSSYYHHLQVYPSYKHIVMLIIVSFRQTHRHAITTRCRISRMARAPPFSTTDAMLFHGRHNHHAIIIV
jgi:hypothetical protein